MEHGREDGSFDVVALSADEQCSVSSRWVKGTSVTTKTTEPPPLSGVLLASRRVTCAGLLPPHISLLRFHPQPLLPLDAPLLHPLEPPEPVFSVCRPRPDFPERKLDAAAPRTQGCVAHAGGRPLFPSLSSLGGKLRNPSTFPARRFPQSEDCQSSASARAVSHCYAPGCDYTIKQAGSVLLPSRGPSSPASTLFEQSQSQSQCLFPSLPPLSCCFPFHVASPCFPCSWIRKREQIIAIFFCAQCRDFPQRQYLFCLFFLS